MAKVLVTGGAGFIGSHLVRALLYGGHSVVVLDNFVNSKRENVPHGPMIEVVQGDITDSAVVRRAMAGCDHMVHLAALVSVPQSIEMPEQTFTSNVLGMHVLLEAARELKFAGWLLYASSAAVYGFLDIPKATEKDADGMALPSPYAASKRTNETEARMYKDVYGVKTLGLRFFNVYGPGQDATSPYSGIMSRVVHSIDSGELLAIYGDGSQTRDYVAVVDVAAVIVALLGRSVGAETPPALNVGSGMAVSLLDMIRQVVALRKVNPRVEYRPSKQGDIKFSCADITLLRGLLPGWQPLSLPAGLRAWFR